MINRNDNPVAWPLLLQELDEAKEHLENLINQMHLAGEVEQEDFAVHLGHIYAHLNRVWHAKNQDAEISDEQRPVYSQFPTDLKPYG